MMPNLTPEDNHIFMKARNDGTTGRQFAQLWDGDITGCSDLTKAAFTLCTLLAAHTQDPEQINRLFRHSQLWRPQWDEPQGNVTYGGVVIASALEAAAIYAECRDLAQEPNILDRLVQELQHSGVVGEERNLKLLYLALTSRVLDQPISLAIKGPSSGGKSFLIGSVVRLFPEEAYYSLTAASEKALLHTQESFKHRMLIFAEAESLKNNFISYLLRTLLSERQLRYETVVTKPNGEFRTQVINKEGPTGLITSTTAVSLHPENETRYWSLLVTESEEQTRAIMKAAAAGKKPAIDPRPWQALQTWIGGQPAVVYIPYAEALAQLASAKAIRIRRDFERFLNLIRASAMLHQATRERQEDGSIVATMQDYCIAYELVSDLMAYGVQAAVPPGVRKFAEFVHAEAPAEPFVLLPSQKTLTGTTVARALQVDEAQAHRWGKEAVKRGYVVNLETRRYQPARLYAGEPLPDDTTVLPSPEQLLATLEGEQRLAA